jgi:hypothetical protein
VDSADKKHWWQKKTFWGVAVATLAGAAAEIPQLAAFRTVLKALETSCLAFAGYGAVEVARSYAAATKQTAKLLKAGASGVSASAK